jgi:type III restriction enzyme
VDFWTTREVREVLKSHVNYMVADTAKWEQVAATLLDQSRHVQAFVKNAGLGFAIPYFHNGQPHEYVPDFIARLDLKPAVHLILETKGHDPLKEVKAQAAHRWVSAVNADGRHGRWAYELCSDPSEVTAVLDRVSRSVDRQSATR